MNSPNVLLLLLLFDCSLCMDVFHLNPDPHSQREIPVSPTITIAEDPRGSLPPQFSLCASFYQSLTTSGPNRAGFRNTAEKLPYHVFLEMRADSSPWVGGVWEDEGLYFRVTNLLEYSTLSNGGFINFEGATSTLSRFGRVTIDGWVHICFSIDAVSGDTLIVVNGEVAYNEKSKFIENSMSKMPKSAVNAVWFYGKTFLSKISQPE